MNIPQVDTDGYLARLVEDYYDEPYAKEYVYCTECEEETEFHVDNRGEGLCSCCEYAEDYFPEHDEEDYRD